MTSSYWVVLLLLPPLIGGCYAWWRFHTIVLWEWVAGVATAILLSILTFAIAKAVITSDSEVISGYVYQACHTPEWHAEWTETEHYTDSDGNTQTRTVTKTQTHYPEWWVETTIGKIRISEGKFEQIRKKFGYWKERGSRPNYDYGDRYDYFSEVKNPDPAKPVYPVHQTKRWANPFLGTNTIKLGKEITKAEAKKLKLFEYPKPNDPFSSRRVIGTAEVSTYRWDQMCAELGETYKVNLTLLHFGNRSIADAVKQRDYWRNGRKNDLVICYGEDWAYVFGWTKSDLVKKELQSLFLENKVDDQLIPAIAEIVKRDFRPYEWAKEEEISRPVPTAAVVIAFLLMTVSQIGIGIAFHRNGYTKDKPKGTRGYAGRLSRYY